MAGDPDQVTVHFVRQRDRPPTSISEEAFEALKEVGGDLVWTSEDECLNVSAKDRRHIYVFEFFQGEAFEHIVSVGNRVYGPVCILACLKHSEILPRHPHPVFSLAMKGMVVSCTNVVKEVREDLHKKLQWMMGTVSKDFHERVTHLVAGEVGSKKYLVAANIKKKIMSPEWVSAVFEASGTSFVHGDSAKFDEYKCPIFKGLVVTVSGLDSEERAEIREVMAREGGSYSGEMKINECTHLIINVPRGQKYEFAKKWKINIVTPKWMFDSLEAGYCLEEHRYKVSETDADTVEDNKQTTSTPTARSRETRLSALSDVSAISVTHVNDTALHNHTLLPGRTLQAVEEDPLDSLEVTTVKRDPFLKGCRICLSGFTGSRLEKLKRVINAGGGTRFNQINESVSHVILGDKVPRDHKLLREADFRPHIVSADWLVESFKQTTRLPETDFYCLDLPPLESSTINESKQKKSTSDTTLTESRPPPPSPPPAVAPCAPAPQDEMEDMQELLSQYLPQNEPDMTDESGLLRAAVAAETEAGQQQQQQPGLPWQQDHGEDEDDDATQDPRQGTIQPDDGTLFGGRQFVFVGFDGNDEEQLALYVQENGGKVLSQATRCVPDFAVVPVFGCPVNLTVNEVVTNAWLQMCIEGEELLPVDSNQLFTPFTVHDSARPLDGCVLSISGYGGTERDVLMHIAELLGGRCQEYFVKKATKQLEPSTHLIVNAPEGSKYNAAKKWKLPAVTKQWLFQCAKSGRKAKELDFLVDKPKVIQPAENTANISNNNSTSNQNKKRSVPPAAKQAQVAESLPAPKPTTEAMAVDAPDEENDLNRSNKENEDAMDVGDTAEPAENNVEVSKDTNTSTRSSRSVTTPRVVNQRVKMLIQENKSETPKLSPSSKLGVETPSKFLDPKKIYNPTFNLTDVLAALDSPEGAKGKGKHQRKSSLPLEDLYAQHVSIAVKKSSISKRSKGASAKASEDQDELVVLKKEAPGPLHGVVIAVSKKLSSQQAQLNTMAASLGAEYCWTYDKSCTHFIFKGRQNDTNREFRTARDQGKLIVCPHWLHMCEEQKVRVDEALFPHTFNPNMSLSMTSSQTPARSMRRSTRLTRSKKKLDDVPPPRSPPEVKPDKGFNDLDTTQSDEEIAMACDGAEQQEQKNSEESLVKNIKDIMAATKTYSKGRRKGKRSTQSNSSFDQILQEDANGSKTGRLSRQSNEDPVAAKKGRLTRSTGNNVPTTKVTPTQAETVPEQSQLCEVAWDDPDARAQQLIMAADLAKNSESFSPNPHCGPLSDDEGRRRSTTSTSEDDAHDVIEFNFGKKKRPTPRQSLEEERVPTPEAPSLAFPVPTSLRRASPPKPIQFDAEAEDEDETMDVEEGSKQTPVFLLSGMAQHERDDYGALVEQLGGEMSDAAHYDSRCSHLVVGNPTRNEKYLACVASGRWVLHKSFFEECRQHGRFVDEEQHEWGGNGTANILGSLPNNVRKLAQAANRWRLRLMKLRQTQPETRGAFEGWIVMLLTDAKRLDGFRRLLEAGGAVVRQAKPPFTHLEDITHAFMDLGKINIQVDLEAFVNAGILCLKPEYIASFLMEHPQPQPEDYYISEVQQLLRGTGFKKRRISEPVTPSSKRRK